MAFAAADRKKTPPGGLLGLVQQYPRGDTPSVGKPTAPPEGEPRRAKPAAVEVGSRSIAGRRRRDGTEAVPYKEASGPSEPLISGIPFWCPEP